MRKGTGVERSHLSLQILKPQNPKTLNGNPLQDQNLKMLRMQKPKPQVPCGTPLQACSSSLEPAVKWQKGPAEQV